MSHFTVKNCFDVVQYGFALPLLFPNARVVIVTRDPRDSGFSNYAHKYVFVWDWAWMQTDVAEALASTTTVTPAGSTGFTTGSTDLPTL